MQSPGGSERRQEDEKETRLKIRRGNGSLARPDGMANLL
jgi:hypothetical protein